ncbi:translation initiation factor IF-2 [Nerophis ophidion]|uniref:translation initiation factor IF-2 n=1 Tax=Nerophis ophidion TaxID=159077 RepID=UPI002AE05AA2|nr:translation initiation factor IF-2 [Nerophis ophidion]
MKIQLLLPLTIAVTVALVVVMKTRRSEHDKEYIENRFKRIKVKVTHSLLAGYQEEKMSIENQIQERNQEEKSLKEAAESAEEKAQKAKAHVEPCQGAVKILNDEAMALQTEFSNLQGENSKEKAAWTAQLESLKKQLQSQSAICAFLKQGIESASKLCSSEGVVEAPKPEETKSEEAKAEESKPEEAKAEESKPEEAKSEESKPEEEKVEDLKPEEAKAEESKPEENKVVAS